AVASGAFRARSARSTHAAHARRSGNPSACGPDWHITLDEIRAARQDRGRWPLPRPEPRGPNAFQSEECDEATDADARGGVHRGPRAERLQEAAARGARAAAAAAVEPDAASDPAAVAAGGGSRSRRGPQPGD